MMPRSWILVAALILTISALAMSGCTSNSPAAPVQNDTQNSTHDGLQTSLSQDKYVAVEEHQQVTSRLVNGSNPFTHWAGPQPVYFNYDGSANGSDWTLSISWRNDNPNYGYYPVVNDSFKMLYGSTYHRDVDMRATRTGIRITGIYGFPHTSEAGFTIENVDRNGTVYARYNNISIVLKPGEQWTSPVTATEVRSYNGTFIDKPYAYTAEFNTTWTLSNLGVIEKANLTRYVSSGTARGFSKEY